MGLVAPAPALWSASDERCNAREPSTQVPRSEVEALRTKVAEREGRQYPVTSPDLVWIREELKALLAKGAP